MTSTIKVNTITTESGSTLTVGGCGKTVALASGASQTGFGRTGTVDWQTGDIKTSTFTAANGEGYFCNTTSGGFTMNLPAGSAGAIVSVQDYNNTFDTGNLTIDPNGSEKINGGDGGETLTLSTEGQGLTLVYIDGTVGWRSIHSDDFSQVPTTPVFVAATGGNTVANSPCGNFKIHTFTGPGTFCVSQSGNVQGSNSVEYIVVAGGGGGGGDGGGGGGAGGFRFASPTLAPVTYPGKPLAAPANVPVTATGFPITVGAGGGSRTHPSPNPNAGLKGSDSVFSTITSTGGGGGGNPFPMAPYGDGGSGGGARGVPGSGAVGQGNTPPVSPPQGNIGGPMGPTPSTSHMGGGGGALAVGSTGQPDRGGPGGNGAGIPPAGFGCNGAANPSPDAFRYYAGGGGGATDTPGQTQSAGGLGGGGIGVSRENGPSVTSGAANTGGGGGGGGNPGSSGSGGSGVVIIRYKFQ